MASSVTPSPFHIPCQAILFDMDGILMSSLGSVERSWKKYAAMRGLDPDFSIGVAHGCRAIDTLARLLPHLDSKAELKVIEQIEIEDTDGLTVLPGVAELLTSLPVDRWAVVTSATERLARARLAAAGIPVPLNFVTGDHVMQGKPHPEPFLMGAEVLGFRPGECVVFEDAPSGVQAGRAAGCIVVATTFSHAAEEVAAANYIVADLKGVTVTILPDGLRLDFA